MEHMDEAASGRVEERLRSVFPADAIARVQVLGYGDDPGVEPGQTAMRVFIDRAGRPAGEDADKEIMIKAKPSGSGPSRGMSGAPAAEQPAGNGMPSPSLMFGLLSVCLLLAAGAYLVGYARGRAAGIEKPDPESLRRSLVAELAVLDDRHEAKAIPEAEWRRKRDHLKKKLMELMGERGS